MAWAGGKGTGDAGSGGRDVGGRRDERREKSAWDVVLVPVHREGWKFVGGALAAGLVLGLLLDGLFWVGVLAAAACAFFFRDPKRVTPLGPGLVVSAADGHVQRVGPRLPPPELGLGDRPLPCVSVFLSALDVHVNRTPVPGRVLRRAYHAGKFLNAALEKASEENERQGFVLEAADGRVVGLVQIAGLVARRIVGFAKEGDRLEPGERIGLIRFGSRCDVYLPEGTAPVVLEGQRAVAGETVLARLEGPQVPSLGRLS